MSHPVPDTSKSAFKQAKEQFIFDHKQKIRAALAILGVANYEVIAAKAKLERHCVGRRLSELEAEGIIYKPGTKSKTKTNRLAYDYCLTTDNTVRTETKNLYKKGQTSAAEFASAVIQLTQAKLF
jgi:hypothetical protein